MGITFSMKDREVYVVRKTIFVPKNNIYYVPVSKQYFLQVEFVV
jgi:hypothetical protein